jgi:hypothetical protein
MVDEATDKSAVVWFPTNEHFTSLPDPTVWASLCLYHDQVIVCSWPLGIERKVLEQIGAVLQGDVGQSLAPGIRELAAATDLASIKAGIKFMDMLDVLEREGVVDAKSWEWARRVHSTGGYETVTREEMYDVTEAHPQVSLEHALLAYAIAHEQGYPIAVDCLASCEAIDPQRSPEHLDAMLAQSAICQLALPGIEAVHADDLLGARAALADELLEFRAGIRRLTGLLHRQIKESRDLHEIRREADVLVATEIKGALMSLENRMRKHENNRIRKMILRSAPVLVDAGTFSWVSLAKVILTIMGVIDSVKPPADQVATYLYGLKRKLR